MGCCKQVKKQQDDLEITNPTGTHIHMSIKSDFNSIDEKKSEKIIQIYYLKDLGRFEKKKMFELNTTELMDSNNEIIYFNIQYNESIVNLNFRYEMLNPIHFMLKYDKSLGTFKIKNYQGSGIYIQCEKKMILNNNSLFSFASTLIHVEINSEQNHESEIILTVIHGINMDKKYIFSTRNNNIIQIGRVKDFDNSIDIEFNDERVSHLQTKLFYYRNKWFIIDGNGLEKKSGNGTWLLLDDYTNVWDGCIFCFGNERFKIEYKEEEKYF